MHAERHYYERHSAALRGSLRTLSVRSQARNEVKCRPNATPLRCVAHYERHSAALRGSLRTVILSFYHSVIPSF